MEGKTGGGQDGSSNLCFIIAGCNFGMVLLLLLITELLIDASVLLCIWLLLFAAVCIIVPIILAFVPYKTVAKYGSIACGVLTVILCILLFYRRNKVTFLYVPEGTTNVSNAGHHADTYAKLKSALYPSGVVVVVGGEMTVSGPMSEDNDFTKAESNELPGTIKKLNERAAKVAGTSGKQEPSDQKLDAFSSLPIEKLTKVYYSGIWWRAIIPLELTNKGALNNEETRKKMGIQDAATNQ